MILTPAQCRAARGWLDWNQKDLAEKAKVSISTVRDFESGKRVPIENNLDALRRAIDSAGIRLLFDNERAAGIAVVDPGHPSVTAVESGKIQGTADRA